MNYGTKSTRLAFVFMSAFCLITFNLKAAENKEKSVMTDSVFTARYVFENLNTKPLELLSHSIRLDMLDYWDVDSVYKAINLMDGLSSLENVTTDYLKVNVSSASTLEIKILPLKKDLIAMTIYTVGSDPQAADSQITFYDRNLNEIPADKHIELPQLKDFFEIPKGSTTKMKEIEEMIPFPTIAYSASSDTNDIKAKLTVEQYINQDDWNIAKLFVKPYITLVWKKDKFKYEK